MKQIKTYGLCYLLGASAAFWLKLYYSQADSDALLWILAPTIGWVRVLSGISFGYLPGIGYVNHDLRFVVAPACAGVQFLIIAILMLTFSFTHRMGNTKRGLVWTLYAAAASYLYTIVVNGIRITLAICLPGLLQQAGVVMGQGMQARFHTIIGVTVYFVSLLLWFQGADRASQKLVVWLRLKQRINKTMRRNFSPLFWYLFIVLGVPFLNRAWMDNQRGFAEYACVILGVCLAVVGISWCINKAAESVRKKGSLP